MRAHVAILRSRSFDEALQVETTRVYGYQAVCPDCWTGERRQVMGTARRDLRGHLEWWHKQRGKEHHG